MSLVFAALSPHPPLLIPTIGRENLNKLEKTKQALEELEKALYISQPDTLVLITPHGKIFKDSFTINANPEFNFDFKEFGDISTQGNFKADLNLIADVSNAAKNQNFPLILNSEPSLDYGSAVPLYYLSRHLNRLKVVPISYSLLELKRQVDFGYFLKEVFMNSAKRIAVIASGDLSHCLSDSGPGGFSPAGKKFDDLVLESLKNKNTTGLMNIEQTMSSEARECGLRSLLILMGVLRNVNYDLKI